MSLSNLDFTGADKLMQMEVFSDMFHKAAFGKFLCRRDGSFVLANNTLAYKLRIPEIAFDRLTIHDLVTPPDIEHTAPFNEAKHQEWFENWFDWPFRLDLESPSRQRPFQLWGYGPCKWKDESAPKERHPFECLIVIKPIYVRELGKMIVVDKNNNTKSLLAFGSVIFMDEFQSFSQKAFSDESK